MNERIRQLAEQCRWQETVTEDGEEWIHAHFDEAKFAQLIVQECAGLVDHVRMEDGTNRGDFIRKHFGVEQ
jgi:hypothetical protein